MASIGHRSWRRQSGPVLPPRIRFMGHVTGDPVRQILDSSDLFVLPSRTEGLPRALIEAMARGLPCIGSAVGGIPELIDTSEMVPPGDPAALAAKIQEVLKDPLRMETLSRRNLWTAREYLDSVLSERQADFLRVSPRQHTAPGTATTVKECGHSTS